MSYPNFQNDTSPLTYDIETKDPGLKDYGPSNYRNNDGCILGVAFTDGDTSCYVPWTSDSNVEYIKDTLGTKRPKIGHSILYDVDWPESLGVKVDGRLHDTCVAENLINENQDSFALDILGTKYFKQGKDLRRITNWCLSEGISPLSAYDNLWRMPDELVGAYAIQDVNLTHRLFQKQQPVLEMRGLSTLYDMECDLLRVLVLFRRTGVRYDKELSLRNSFELIKKLDIVKDCLEVRYNNLNPNSSKQVGPWFDKLGIDYPLSPTGLPSIKKELLEALVDADETGDDLYLPRLVLRGRTYSKSEQDCLSKLREDFVCLMVKFIALSILFALKVTVLVLGAFHLLALIYNRLPPQNVTLILAVFVGALLSLIPSVGGAKLIIRKSSTDSLPTMQQGLDRTR